MKYQFDTVKMLNKVVRLTAPISAINNYSVSISTQNFICECGGDPHCHSIEVFIWHDTRKTLLKVSLDNWSDEKTNRMRLNQIKNLVKSIAE